MADRDVLVRLFQSTGGAEWERKDNWDTDTDISLWYGVKVNEQGRVVELSLVDNYLRGRLVQRPRLLFYCLAMKA